MKIELEVPDEAAAQFKHVKEMNGLTVFVSAYCVEHRVAVIVARPRTIGLDVACAVDRLGKVAKIIVKAAQEESSEN